jgi:NMD protein affecting ribosome stability and mRNA decay
MTECRNCGANCDPSDVEHGICEDCRSPEAEIRILPMVTDKRRAKAYEFYERNGAEWQVTFTKLQASI